MDWNWSLGGGGGGEPWLCTLITALITGRGSVQQLQFACALSLTQFVDICVEDIIPMTNV
jgi:hypothetical protein